MFNYSRTPRVVRRVASCLLSLQVLKGPLVLGWVIQESMSLKYECGVWQGGQVAGCGEYEAVPHLTPLPRILSS